MIDLIFEPSWASPPGQTIKDVLLERNITKSVFANEISRSEEFVDRLLIGQVRISKNLALQLEKIFGSSVKYWVTREKQYRQDLGRVKEEALERKLWVRKLPTNDMIRFGWIDSSISLELACLSFFGVKNVNDWHKKYSDLISLTAFRISNSFDSEVESVLSWLRIGQLEAIKVTGNWDRTKFANSLKVARDLTRESNPQIFIPLLTRIFSECGVAIVVARAPKRCKASGAAFFASTQKAVMILSGRHLSDDHFWFSFFHEAAHLLLHGNKDLYLEFDRLEKKHITNSASDELEANNFAEEILIPKAYKSDFHRLNHMEWKKIVRFAKKLGISPGIVVGQLQYHELIDRRYLNKLKKRYRWDNNKLVQSNR